MEGLIHELVHFGLSEKEAAVYVASLELGSAASVQDIAHQAKVNRATTYVMIETLIRRGLMSTVDKGQKRYYLPEAPERLRSILRLQRKELEEKERELDRTLPLLTALSNVAGVKPHVRYLEGPEGLQSVRDLFTNLKGEFIQIVPIDDSDAYKQSNAGRPEHMARLAAAQTSSRALLVMRDLAAADIPDVPCGEVRLVPAERFPIHGELSVREHTVFLHSYASALLSVVVTSKEVADVVRALFNMAWEGAAVYPSKKGSNEPKSAANP